MLTELVNYAWLYLLQQHQRTTNSTLCSSTWQLLFLLIWLFEGLIILLFPTSMRVLGIYPYHCKINGCSFFFGHVILFWSRDIADLVKTTCLTGFSVMILIHSWIQAIQYSFIILFNTLQNHISHLSITGVLEDEICHISHPFCCLEVVSNFFVSSS